MLYKVRELVSTDTLRCIYYAIFDSHLNYGIVSACNHCALMSYF